MSRLITGPVPQLSAPIEEAPTSGGPLRVVAWPARYLTSGVVGPSTRISGAEVTLHTLLRDSAERGHEVTVVTGASSGGTRTVDGVQVVGHGQGRRVLAKADVVVGQINWPRDMFQRAAQQRIPVVYLIHNESETRERGWKLGPDAATVVVFNSEHIAARGADRWDGPSTVVRPPTLPADYPPVSEGTMVTAVNAAPEKGINTVYRAAAKLPQHRFLVVAGGYGNQQKPPAALKHVTWQAPTRHMVRDVYHRTRLLVMPSIRESWGRVACEAAMCGIPIVAHPNDGLTEALGDDGAVWIDRNDADGWRAEIDRLMTDPAAWGERQAASHAAARRLAEAGAGDLDRWDRTLRAAAAATGRRRPATAGRRRGGREA